MDEKMFFKIRIYFTGIVTIAIWTLLAWNYYHGGVPSHHILNDKDLPEISNWWGGLLLPFLTWFLLYRIQKRIVRHNNGRSETSNYQKHTLYRFTGSLLFGVLLSVFFTFGYSDLSGYMILGLLPLALYFPIFRAECLLGFVIGMTFTFGAVLPTGIGSILTLVSAILYILVRPGILYIASKFVQIASSNK
ncbi:hypothetical protein [Flavobacterium sp. W20_MBD1_R3]|uniref:hypothetical protein n=1 Tax=Flavobacterium sp. W20_MBD1_R3 TaxID=3240278 RepID=UPI003F912345